MGRHETFSTNPQAGSIGKDAPSNRETVLKHREEVFLSESNRLCARQSSAITYCLSQTRNDIKSHASHVLPRDRETFVQRKTDN